MYLKIELIRKFIEVTEVDMYVCCYAKTPKKWHYFP
ncbi:hypothetical protein Fleli_2648 [Bernardetia litoralis DSM 6794]|uniref:Uncharacterized protein n=1 Tax=Bernardetia litoralis (strain ATCC 23117 / DSM 6794 / NBRC 15988 / NCIMB 1366 / Fx l1 / Sio-4) TaxID=880071 RepID=I4AM23_BERLS|nr:hypothetical protein Fleli_2648 [Bernardetia litoralis DSM 6794]